MSAKISDNLLQTIAESNNIIIFIHRAAPFSCSLETLRRCNVLKIIVFNENMVSQIQKYSSIFDQAISYLGPKPGSLVIGNPNPSDSTTDSSLIDADVEEIVRSLLQNCLPKAKDQRRVFLVTSGESLLVQVSLLREKFGLSLGMPSGKAKLFIDKSLMKVEYSRLGIPSPPSICVPVGDMRDSNSLEKIHKDIHNGNLNYPLFVKPISGSGSIETCEIHNPSELESWIITHKNSPYEQFLFENKLFPPLYVADVVSTLNGIVEVIGVARLEHGFAEFVSKKIPAAQMQLNPEVDPDYFKVAEFARNGLKKLNVDQHPGCYFMEIMQNGKGELNATEIAARHPIGGNHTRNVELCTEFDLESYAICWPFLQDIPNLKIEKYRCAAGTIIYPCNGGILVNNLTPSTELLVGTTKIEQIIHYYKPNDTLPVSSSIVELSCEICLIASSQADLLRTIKNLTRDFTPIATRKQN